MLRMLVHRHKLQEAKEHAESDPELADTFTPAQAALATPLPQRAWTLPQPPPSRHCVYIGWHA